MKGMKSVKTKSPIKEQTLPPLPPEPAVANTIDLTSSPTASSRRSRYKTDSTAENVCLIVPSSFGVSWL